MENQTGIELIAKEREEQIIKHGKTVESDVRVNSQYELSDVAMGILYTPLEVNPVKTFKAILPYWDETFMDKVFGKTYKERLIIAGALIATELDRITAIED